MINRTRTEAFVDYFTQRKKILEEDFHSTKSPNSYIQNSRLFNDDKDLQHYPKLQPPHHSNPNQGIQGAPQRLHYSSQPG